MMNFLRKWREPKITFKHHFDIDFSDLTIEDGNPNRKVYGPIFITSHRNIWYRWRLHLYPSGGVYLSYLEGAKEEVQAWYRVVVKGRGSKGGFGRSQGRSSTFQKAGPPHGQWQFWRISDFRNNSKSLEIEVTIRIGVEHFDILKILSVEPEVEKPIARRFRRHRNSYVQDVGVVWSDEEEESCYFGPLFKDVEARERSMLSDIQVLADDYVVFHCHKFVLHNKIPEFFQGKINIIYLYFVYNLISMFISCKQSTSVSNSTANVAPKFDQFQLFLKNLFRHYF